MKIVAVLGSPRSKGNSGFIAREFLKGAKKAGAQTTAYELNQMQFRGCQACMACKTGSENCVLRDDLAPALDAVAKADVLVLASPVYYGEVTGQMKCFVDRTFCYLTPEFKTGPKRSRLAPGKTLVFIQTQGAPASAYKDLFPRYQQMMGYHSFGKSLCIRAAELNGASDAASRADVLKQISESVRQVMGK